MTREEKEEAIKRLKKVKSIIGLSVSEKMSLDMAIKALEQEPCETQMIDKSNFSQEQYKADLQCAYDCGKASVKPCEDAVSRQAVEKITWEEPSYSDALNVLTEVRDKVRALPPVNAQPKTGHWILTNDDDYEYCTCSECGYQNGENWMIGSQIKYCQECGCRMVEPQESEEV